MVVWCRLKPIYLWSEGIWRCKCRQVWIWPLRENKRGVGKGRERWSRTQRTPDRETKEEEGPQDSRGRDGALGLFKISVQISRDQHKISGVVHSIRRGVLR
jgi:hypothetical protein